MNSRRDRIQPFLLATLIAFTLPAAWATPQFAREHGTDCTSCHTVPPMLSEDGLAFQAGGYPLPGPLSATPRPATRTIPIAAWITMRYEDAGDDGPSDLFLPKLELVSGGRIGAHWSYFVEWRLVSQGLRSDGTLSDRGGRFEDLFAEWQPEGDRLAVKIGQYRSLNQTDVSLRLSADEPLLFRNAVRTGSDSDPRRNALEAFSPSGRSPSIGVRLQSIRGDRASDGLFHFFTLPFVGEFSVPLSDAASDSASFELGGPKGVYAETFYRRGLRSVGAHAFIGGDGSWLVNALGSVSWGDTLITAGVGIDDDESRGARERGSVQLEYILPHGRRFRAAGGIRFEEVSEDGNPVAYVPYLVIAAPNSSYTYLLQMQYRTREGDGTFIADLSLLF